MFRGFLCRLSGRFEEPGVIDSQNVRTKEHPGHDAERKIEGRERHVIADADVLPPVQRVNEASIQDRDGAVPLIRELADKFPTGSLGPTADTRVRNCWPDCPGRARLDRLLEIARKPEDVKGIENGVGRSSSRSAC